VSVQSRERNKKLNISDRIKALPAIKDEAGSECVSREVVLGLVAAEPKEWRTIIVGLPIVRKLLAGEDVVLNDFHVNFIPDDVLFKERA